MCRAALFLVLIFFWWIAYMKWRLLFNQFYEGVFHFICFHCVNFLLLKEDRIYCFLPLACRKRSMNKIHIFSTFRKLFTSCMNYMYLQCLFVLFGYFSRAFCPYLKALYTFTTTPSFVLVNSPFNSPSGFETGSAFYIVPLSHTSGSTEHIIAECCHPVIHSHTIQSVQWQRSAYPLNALAGNWTYYA